MKRIKKKDMLDIIAELRIKGDSITYSNLENGSVEIIKILEECQEDAIILGNNLETCEEKEDSFISILEDYCENLYQISISLSNKQKCKNILIRTSKQLDDLKEKIEYCLPDDKKEIVFFPYKASMWDSLESIWKAAWNDKSCDAYVVPIPYFDVNTDGSLGEIHYEGDLYPSYVPVIPWKEYSLELHKPDIAYVHNPYDNWNRVTCIHPSYFAKELKKYVDKLVYVPYFITAIDMVNQAFCVTPVTVQADKIIVQSESIRQIYIKELRKFEKENDCVGVCGDLEKKIIALGSPKFDKLKTTESNSIELPEAWSHVIYKKDGSRKKIVLFNTSIQNMLTYGEQMIEKISDSLRIFEKNKEEIALIWRPHPLIISGLQSMRPHLKSKFVEVVDKYKMDGWGIYDDTPEIDRAIIISDAYYGDAGSVLALYKSTGKPLLEQNISQLSYVGQKQ